MQSDKLLPTSLQQVVEEVDNEDNLLSDEAVDRIEARLSAESAQILNRRMQQIWSDAMRQLEPLVDALHRDDKTFRRSITQHVGVAMQVHSFDPNGEEERKNLRVIRGNVN